MASFYEVHQRAIEAASFHAPKVSDRFRVVMWEPLPAPRRHARDAMVENNTPTIVTFRRLPNGRYEAADACDRKAIAEFNLRHRDTPVDAWHLPSFARTNSAS